jgi:hypothetical protein
VTRPQGPQLHGGPHLGEIRLPPQYVNPAESWMETMKEYLPGGDTSLPPTMRGVRGWPAAAQGKWNVTVRQLREVVDIGQRGHLTIVVFHVLASICIYIDVWLGSRPRERCLVSQLSSLGELALSAKRQLPPPPTPLTVAVQVVSFTAPC